MGGEEQSWIIVIGAAIGCAVLTFLYRRWVKKLDAETARHRGGFGTVDSPDASLLGDGAADKESVAQSMLEDAADLIGMNEHFLEMLGLSAKPPSGDLLEPSRDPIDVATRIAESHQTSPWFTSYVEAACVLRAADRAVPGIESTLRDLIDASRDAQGALDAAEKMPGDQWYTVEGLLAASLPAELAELAMRTNRSPFDLLVHELATRDVGHVLKLVDHQEDPRHQEELLFGAALSSDDDRITERFVALKESLSAEDREMYEEVQLRRLARRDADAARDVLLALRDERGIPLFAGERVLAAVARDDESKARAFLPDDHASAEPYDVLPIFLGLHRAGIDVDAELGDLASRLSALSYRVPDVARELLRHAMERATSVGASLLEEVLKAIGGSAWQVALLARDPLRALARRDQVAAERCLLALLETHPPGPLAARDASIQTVAGHVMLRPDWMRFEEANPLELLVLQVALGEAGPRWAVNRDS